MSSAAGYAPMGTRGPGGPGRMMSPTSSYGGSPGPSIYGGASGNPASSPQRAVPMPMTMPPQQVQAGPQGTLPPGTKIMVGKIVVTVQKYLSQGGFAHVYLVTTEKPIPVPVSATTVPGGTAVTTRGETLHVLKRMAVPDKEALAGVRSEVEIHKSIRAHPNIVHFVEASASALRGGGYEVFILMEYCSGGGIIDLMNARLRTRLSEGEILKIFGDVAAGLQVMHSMDPPIMHRDLKVENILLSPPPRSNPSVGPTYKLCDFGSAKPLLTRKAARSLEEVKRLEADLNMHTTLQYRAPEMVDVYQRRTIDEKADIWAMGVLLYKLCYYTTPFEENGGGPLAILNARYRFPHMPPYSQRLKDLIASMLQEYCHMRPTIEEVMLRVHIMLGTKPPAFLLKTSQAANGEALSTPTGARGPAPKLPRRNSQDSRSQSGTADDLIALGPSDADRRRTEEENLKKQAESIIPMRRGRPTKVTATPEKSAPSQQQIRVGAPRPASASPTRPSQYARTDFGAPRPPSASPTRPSSSTQKTSEGFGDSFAPSDSPEASSSRPQSVLKHSPKLPGFDTPSRASPVPPLLPPSGMQSSAKRNGTLFNDEDVSRKQSKAADAKDNEGDATSRFPSVEELDVRYPTDGATTKSPIRSSTVNIPGLDKRDSVTAMAGRFAETRKDGKPPSFSNLQRNAMDARRLPLSGVSAPQSPRSQPDLPIRKQIHKDWLKQNAERPTPQGARSEAKSTPLPAPNPPHEEAKEITEGDDSSGDEDNVPEDPDAPKSGRQLGLGADTFRERRAAAMERASTTSDTMARKPSVPGKVQPPSWVQETPPTPSQPAQPMPASEDELSEIRVETPSSPLLDAPKQGAQAPAWDEDDEEMHFLPQPTLGTADERHPQPTDSAASAVPKSHYRARGERQPAQSDTLIDIGEPEYAATEPMSASLDANQPRPKQYADASTSPHHASVDDLSAQEEAQTPTPPPEPASPDFPKSTPAPRPVVAPKPKRFSSSKEVEGLIDRLEGTDIAAKDGVKKQPDVPKKPININDLLKTYESLANGASVRHESGQSSVAVEAEPAKRKPPVVAPKPSTMGKTGLKPWEREALEREQVQRFGSVREKRETKDGSPEGGNASTSPPAGEAQERFRGVSSLISQWQNNASRGAPGWGTVGAAGDDDQASNDKGSASMYRASALVADDGSSLVRTGSIGGGSRGPEGLYARGRLGSREV